MTNPIKQAIEDLEQSVLDMSYYIHLATKAKIKNKWIDCEIYKITGSLDNIEKALQALREYDKQRGDALDALDKLYRYAISLRTNHEVEEIQHPLLETIKQALGGSDE